MAFPHGSPRGYDLGCDSHGGCAFAQHNLFLTCVEAATARRRDYALSKLPADQPIPRPERMKEFRRWVAIAEAQVHGSVWGYRRGCRSAEVCPNRMLGRITCSEAKRRYYRAYATDRLHGVGTPIEHGTRRGYDLGCREGVCPGDESGVTCTAARSAERIARVRSQGVLPRAVDPTSALAVIARLRAAGLSLRRIAAISGVGRATVSALARQDSVRAAAISPATSAAILSIDLDAVAPVRRQSA